MKKDKQSRRERLCDWEWVRDWCVWYLDIFLEYARDPSDDSKATYRRLTSQQQLRPIDWKQVRRCTDISLRYVFESITDEINEAVSTRYALPGDFRDAVALAAERQAILKKGLSADDTWSAFVEVEDKLEAE